MTWSQNPMRRKSKLFILSFLLFLTLDIDLHRAIYASLDYSVSDVEQSAGAAIALSDDKVTVLMGRMRNPSLSIHGIEGAFSGPGGKTVIPAKVTGKFSIRYVMSIFRCSL